MTQIALSPEDLKCLSRVLSAALDETVDIDHLEEVTEGTNAVAKHHKKAVLTGGREIGLKAAERVSKGTVREFLLANTAKILNIPGSGACGIFLMSDGLPLSRMQVVALEWLLDAEQIGKLNTANDVTDKRKSADTAGQLGQWIWLCLCFGVSDRGMQNWIWSELRDPGNRAWGLIRGQGKPYRGCVNRWASPPALAERLLAFERLDEAWPHAVAEHATFDLKSASRAVRT